MADLEDTLRDLSPVELFQIAFELNVVDVDEMIEQINGHYPLREVYSALADLGYHVEQDDEEEEEEC